MQYDNDDYLKPIAFRSQKDKKGFSLEIKIGKLSHTLLCGTQILTHADDVEYLKKYATGYLPGVKKLIWTPVYR